MDTPVYGAMWPPVGATPVKRYHHGRVRGFLEVSARVGGNTGDARHPHITKELWTRGYNVTVTRKECAAGRKMHDAPLRHGPFTTAHHHCPADLQKHVQLKRSPGFATMLTKEAVTLKTLISKGLMEPGKNVLSCSVNQTEYTAGPHLPPLLHNTCWTGQKDECHLS
jgi:hypothetical protein